MFFAKKTFPEQQNQQGLLIKTKIPVSAPDK